MAELRVVLPHTDDELAELRSLDQRGKLVSADSYPTENQLAQLEDIEEFGYDPNQPRDPKGSPTGGQWIAKEVADLTLEELWRDGQEYEGRLFGGAYDWSRVEGPRGGSAAKDAPMRKAILQARGRYNAIRIRLGLEAITDWRVRPVREQLIQYLERPREAGR